MENQMQRGSQENNAGVGMCTRTREPTHMGTQAWSVPMGSWSSPQARKGRRRLGGILFVFSPTPSTGGGRLGQLRGKHQLEAALGPEACPWATWAQTLHPTVLFFVPQEHMQTALFTHSEGDPSWSHFLTKTKVT